MKEFIARVTAWPFVAHWIRAITRYLGRLGIQSAAAITYFSVLAMLPVMMVSFSVVGLTLTVLRPELLTLLKDLLVSSLSDATNVSDALVTAVEQAASSWRTLGSIGLVTALWVGAKWVEHLKRAVRVQLRAAISEPDPKKKPWVEVPLNLLILLAMLLFVLLTFALWIGTTVIASGLLDALDLPGEVTSALWRLLAFGATLLVTFVLFVFFFRVFPVQPLPWMITVKGAALGAIGTTGLQAVASVLFGVFSGNAAAAAFGPIIVLMLFFNLFAQIIIITAAWIGTADVPAEPDPTDEPLESVTPLESSPGAQSAPARANVSPVAAGYLTGAATGLGLGAVLASRAGRRRTRKQASRELGQ